MKWLLNIPFWLFSIISYGQDTLATKSIDSIVSIIDADITLQRRAIKDTERVFLDPKLDTDNIRTEYKFVTIEVFSNENGEVRKLVYSPKKSNPGCPDPKTSFYYYKSKAIKAIVVDYMRILPHSTVYYFDSVIYYVNDQSIKTIDKKDSINPNLVLSIFYEFSKK